MPDADEAIEQAMKMVISDPVLGPQFVSINERIDRGELAEHSPEVTALRLALEAKGFSESGWSPPPQMVQPRTELIKPSESDAAPVANGHQRPDGESFSPRLDATRDPAGACQLAPREMPPEPPTDRLVGKILALGSEGKMSHFLNPHADRVSLGLSDWGHHSLMHHFGEAALMELAPIHETIYGKDSRGVSTERVIGRKLVGFDDRKAADMLHRAIEAAGLFTAEQERRRGGWRQGDDFLYHAGDVLYINGVAHPPGWHDGYCYPRQRPGLHPWPSSVIDSPGETFLSDLAAWNMDDLARYCILGWFVCGLFGAALARRPHLSVTGPSGSGKTTGGEYLRDVAGGNDCCLWTSDSSEAALRVQGNHVAQHFIHDEAEGQPRVNDARNAVLRYAGDGKSGHRSTTDHRDVHFAMQSCFCLLSINPLPVLEQDENRFVHVELGPLPPMQQPPRSTLGERALIGRKLLRLAIDRWAEWAKLDAAYNLEFRKRKWSHRRANTLGMIFAGAHVATISGAPTSEQIGQLFKRLGVERMQASDGASLPQHERAWAYFLSTRIPFTGQPQHPVGTWIADACNPERREAAEKTLLEHGLRILRNGAGAPVAVALAYQHRSLQEIAAAGGWRLDTLRRLPGATTGKWRFGPTLQSAGVALPIALVIGGTAAG